MKTKYQLVRLALLFICSCPQISYSQNFIDKYLSDPLVYTIIGTSANSISSPRDLDFKPHTNELWVVNNGASQGGNVVVFYNAGQISQTSQYRKDTHTSHFMRFPSALAFSNIGEWASTGEIQSTASGNSTFMGPSLWSADTNIFAKVFQNNWINGYPLGSHLDMLHQSPFAMGIAFDSLKAYWVYDGWNGNICKYDFNVDHSPGYDIHSAGKIWRYTDVNILRAVGIPSHMVLDPTTKWLYIVDAGNKRLMRMNTLTGTIVGNLTAPNEALTSYKNVTGCTQEVIDTYTSQPTGIDYYNNRLIVSDYSTGDIRIYSTSTATPTLIGTIPTGQSGIMGVKIGNDGKIWFVNNILNTVVRIDPLPTINDASVLEITSPITENAETKFYSSYFNECQALITPVVKIQNLGSNNLTSTNINYSIDGGVVNTYSWTGNIPTGVVASVTLSSVNIPAGTHKIIVYTSNPNGNVDMNLLNDRKEGSFRTHAFSNQLPFGEDFTNTSFPPNDWAYVNFNKYCKMSRSASVGGYGVGLGALKMDNFTGPMNITGQKDYFISPRVNFSNASEITFLTFDLAYARRNSGSTDQLQVSISVDCGSSWTTLYSKAGSVLSTTTDVNYAYTPSTAEEWRTDSIDLGVYQGQSEVMFKFTTNSNWGNNLYLDNINITTISTVGITTNKSIESINVYPNPSQGNIIVDGINYAEDIHEIIVCNIIGQEILRVKPINQGYNKSILLDLTPFTDGTYFVHVKSKSSSLVKKVIVSKN